MSVRLAMSPDGAAGLSVARHTFAATGAIAVLVPVDADGLETERLEKIEARLAYVTPSHH